MSQPLDHYDAVGHFWCPMLGQPLHFGYCRRAAEGRPCPKIIDCYTPHFAVEEFLLAHFGPEELARILAPPKSRLERVAEALAQAEAVRPGKEES
ncbi:MAG: hypothetical protein KQJ78_11930 [Deltaproteobacteria bacterium]|nr:hypothetical protein [Deltaproteobacteria bacterium]